MTPERRQEDRRKSLRERLNEHPKWVGYIGAPVLLLIIGWAAKPLAPVTSSRFEADSSRRETRYRNDSTLTLAKESRRDSIAETTAAKVNILVCRPLPPAEREACLKK